MNMEGTLDRKSTLISYERPMSKYDIPAEAKATKSASLSPN